MHRMVQTEEGKQFSQWECSRQESEECQASKVGSAEGLFQIIERISDRRLQAYSQHSRRKVALYCSTCIR